VKNTLRRLIPLCAVGFFCFLIWVIYLANTGKSSIFFQLIASIPYGDKLGHFSLFGLLTLVTNFAFKLKSYKVYSMELYFGTVLVAIFVTIEECSQYFIPNRTFDLFDLLADFIGIVFFNFITIYLRKYRGKHASLHR
jgi:VanZ family protein